LDEKSFIQEIQQLGLPKENTDAIAKQYRENKENLRSKFSQDSYRVSKLLATDWRVDHIISSSEGNLNSSIHLKLQVDSKPELGLINRVEVKSDGNRLKDIAFELSSEQLDILVHELSNVQKLLANT
jgi:hypothetical protein